MIINIIKFSIKIRKIGIVIIELLKRKSSVNNERVCSVKHESIYEKRGNCEIRALIMKAREHNLSWCDDVVPCLLVNLAQTGLIRTLIYPRVV